MSVSKSVSKSVAKPVPVHRAGQQLGRFRLLATRGRGAQATVWRAHDGRLDREVALKLLTADNAGQPLSPWLHEARAVSRLAHPHIVPVFEADEFDGQACLVFELVPGQTLAQRLQQTGAFAVEQRLPVWSRRQVNAPSFLLLPMVMKGLPFALIHADLAQPGGLLLGERELALLRTLLNQAVMPFRQAAAAA